jgi:hypothetical protein
MIKGAWLALVLLACTSCILQCQTRPLPNLQNWLGLGKQKASEEGEGMYPSVKHVTTC